jgi:hypothetical protein
LAPPIIILEEVEQVEVMLDNQLLYLIMLVDWVAEAAVAVVYTETMV